MNINYKAVIADLESQKNQLEAAIAAMRSLMGRAVREVNPPNFSSMKMPDAAKQHLATVGQRLSTREIMKALEAGGLPCKYITLYRSLSRRQSKVGDIINMKGYWALKEWYPNSADSTQSTMPVLK